MRELRLFAPTPNAGRLLQVGQDALDLLQGGAEVVRDLLSEDVGLGQARGVLQALVPEPEQVEADLVAGDDLPVGVGPQRPFGVFSDQVDFRLCRSPGR